MTTDSITASYIELILTHLMPQVIVTAGRRVRRSLNYKNGQQALQRSLYAAFVALLAEVRTSTRVNKKQLEDIFSKFFRDPDFIQELRPLLRGNPLDKEELTVIFYDLEIELLPGLDLMQALSVFEAAFIAAASEDIVLQPIVQSGQLLQYKQIDRVLLREMRALVAFLRQVKPQSVTIEAGDIKAYNVVVGPQSFQFALPDSRSANRAKHLRQAYLEHLFTTLRQVPISSVDPTATNPQAQLQLDGIYTPLLTLSSQQHGRWQYGTRHLWQERLSALAQLNLQYRLVLMGDPGSGKSTFINYVTLCLAGEALNHKDVHLRALTEPLPKSDGEREKERQVWRHGSLLPVRVILRDFAARGIFYHPITEENLWDFIADELKAAQLADYAPYLRQSLQNERCLLLLDGLDEVPAANERRIQIKTAILCFVRAFPRCRVIVTSRTYAYQKAEWKLRDFAEALLAPFNEGQIRYFVNHWYTNLAEQRKQKHVPRYEGKEEAQRRAQRLLQVIEQNKKLNQLAEQPLLLTLMSTLHAWRGGHLLNWQSRPAGKREKLYADMVDLLFYLWEQQPISRHDKASEPQLASLAELLNIESYQITQAINQLAYETHHRQPQAVGTADIPQLRLVSALLSLNEDSEIGEEELLNYLDQRHGLLLGRGQNVYKFVHRTFQEYLAACHLTDYGYPTTLAQLARQEPNRWREVLLLSAAKMTRGGAWAIWPLIEALCFREPNTSNTTEEDLWGALLAGQALKETTDLSKLTSEEQSKLERVQRWQLHLLRSDTLPPIERTQAGKTLAILGDPRFCPAKWHLADDKLLGFIEIPAGPFTMGSMGNSLKFWGSETPQHKLELPRYWMARYPVTLAQWLIFFEESAHKLASAKSLKGIANHPVRWVTWHEAMAYSNWLHQTLLHHASQYLEQELSEPERAFWQGLQSNQLIITLPSEAEWEKAARGTNARTYPWGEAALPAEGAEGTAPKYANYDETGIGTTSTVGAFPRGASPYGCEEMSGNVWEWTRTIWGNSYSKAEFVYPYNPNDGREALQSNKHRVLRGGAFDYDVGHIRCAARNYLLPKAPWGGFRVVVSPVSSTSC